MGLKNYLSADDRRDFIKLYHLKDHANAFIKNQHKYGNLTDREFHDFTKAIAHLESGTISMIKRLDERAAKQLIRDNEHTNLFLLPTSEANQKEKEYFESLEDTITVKQDVIYDLALQALSNCSDPCPEKDKANCKLKEIFMSLDLPMCDAEATDCPYMRGSV